MPKLKRKKNVKSFVDCKSTPYLLYAVVIHIKDSVTVSDSSPPPTSLQIKFFSQFSSVAQCPTLCDPRHRSMPASLSFTNSHSLLKLMSVESVMPSNHLILCCPLLLSPSIFPSIKVFSNESAPQVRWPKYWSFSFSSSPSNEYSGLIYFRIDWFDLAVQGTLKSLPQHHSSKTSILRYTDFFKIQPSHPCMTTGKTVALTRQTFVDKMMS